MVQISLEQRANSKQLLKGLDKKIIEEEVNNNQTKWLFNPPCSPWMSGAMESIEKVTKRALKAVYLPMLTEQKKWSSLNANLKKGDLVLLCDKNLKQSHWPLERVVETLPGPDNVFVLLKYKRKTAVMCNQ